MNANQRIGEDEDIDVQIQHLRVQNSLLKVSSLPNEILGEIFACNIFRGEYDYGHNTRFEHNFMSVCHHWRAVALSTPELWSWWGPTIRAWHRRSAFNRPGLVDLFLDDTWYFGSHLNPSLCEALRGHVTEGEIRRIDLTASVELIEAILSLISNGGSLPRSLVELSVTTAFSQTLDLSKLLSNGPLPRLRRLDLTGCRVTSDALKCTTALTALTLVTLGPEPTPTLPQLLSVLSANPLLRHLELGLLRSIGTAQNSAPVPLPLLDALIVDGPFHAVFPLLQGLGLPNRLGVLKIDLFRCTPQEVSDTLPQYVGQRAQRWDGGLKVLVLTDGNGPLHICVGSSEDDAGWFLTADAHLELDLGEGMGSEELERAGLQYIANIPQSRIVDLRTTSHGLLRSQELCVGLRSLESLRLVRADFPASIAEWDRGLLPCLRSLAIIELDLGREGDWRPFIGFLAGRADMGSRILILGLGELPHRNEAVDMSILGAVGSFERLGYVVECWAYEWLRLPVDQLYSP